MEMTTVSPSPASPTEGDDLCEIDGTSVAIHSVTLLICLCGLVGNGAVLGLLSLKRRNTGIFVLAFTDFLFLLFTFPAALLLLVEDMSCSPIMPLLYLIFLFQLSMVSCYWALLWLMYNINNFNGFYLCMLCCHWDRPKRLLWLVFSVPYWVLIALIPGIAVVTYTQLSHKQQQSLAFFISLYAILLLCAAATVILITINFIKAMRGSRKQQPRRRHIIFLLIVLLIIVLSICNFLQQLGYTVVSSEIFFLLTCIHSSIKPFIYFLAGMCWRPCSLRSLQLSLQRAFDKQKEKPARRSVALMDTGV